MLFAHRDDLYEMGSVIKPLTVAAGIDSESITASSLYNDTGTAGIYFIGGSGGSSNYGYQPGGTANAAANGIHLLLSCPEVLRLLRSSEELLERATNEILRIPHFASRYVRCQRP